MEWSDTYGIQHWSILWRSNRKLAWEGFKTTTNEFILEALTNCVIGPWIQLAFRATVV